MTHASPNPLMTFSSDSNTISLGGAGGRGEIWVITYGGYPPSATGTPFIIG